jgi:hypothetical protein
VAAALAVCLLTPIDPGLKGQTGRAVTVEPGELTHRRDLIGREVQVDDRIGRYQFHPEKGIDQIFLKRAPDVPFELPPNLRPERAPSLPCVIVRGTLRKEEDRIYVDVSSFDAMPSDLDRLTRGVSTLPRADYKGRYAWASWAANRAKVFGDEALARRAKEIDEEALVAEAERSITSDSQAHWLELADRARAHAVDETLASALAHRGLRLGLASAKTARELQALVARIESYLPESKVLPTNPADLTKWERAYLNDAWSGYRAAPEAARAVFDRRLWADAVEKEIARRASDEPAYPKLIALAGEAAARLPDRLGVAEGLIERGVAAGSKEVAALRQGEVDALASLYRDRLHQPDKALALYRAWLDDQRLNRLSRRDADGRIALAHQYGTLLNDEATAVALLREADSIDPNSRDARDAFLRLGFRKIKGAWKKPDNAEVSQAPTKPKPEGGADEAHKGDEPAVVPVPDRGDSLRNATPEEVRARLGGRPDAVVRSASQGQVIEQWIYYGKGQNQFVNFARKAGELRSRVVAYYSLPRDMAEPSGNP